MDKDRVQKTGPLPSLMMVPDNRVPVRNLNLSKEKQIEVQYMVCEISFRMKYSPHMEPMTFHTRGEYAYHYICITKMILWVTEY